MSVPPNDLPSPPPSPSHDYLDDVFTSHPDSGIKDSSLHPSSTTKLQRVHYDNGYRDGISTSKGTHVQDGFDEGYPLGAELALQAGVLLGALKQLCQDLERCLTVTRDENMKRAGQTQINTDHHQSSDGGQTGRSPSSQIPTVGQALELKAWAKSLSEVQSLYAEAEKELALQHIFGKDYFGEDGVWTWDVQSMPANTPSAQKMNDGKTANALSGGDDTDTADSSIREVAHAHPLIMRWRERMKATLHEFGLDDTGFSWVDALAEQEIDRQRSNT